MALFTDVVTIYQKISDIEWKQAVVKGVQWSEVAKRVNSNGVITVHRELTITFPKDVYEAIDFNIFNEETGIFYGKINEEIADVKGRRLSDLLKKYPKGGIVKVVRDNSNRDLLKHVKVVVE